MSFQPLNPRSVQMVQDFPKKRDAVLNEIYKVIMPKLEEHRPRASQ
jgi:hypothetical protein